jgi:hypothetical protein
MSLFQVVSFSQEYVSVWSRQSRGGVVDIVTRYGLDGSGIEYQWVGAILSAPVPTGRVATQPPI